MKGRLWLLCGMVLGLVACARTPPSCPACERPECVGASFRVVKEDGRTVKTCCARCGWHYAKTVNARELWATDRASGQWIDATKAVYVEGSAINGCTGMEVRRDAEGCCYVKGFDRCLPSLLAFASEEKAAEFVKSRGGAIVDAPAIKGATP